MDIDITDSTSHEIIQILTSFPNGRLVIKQDRILWDSVSLEPVQRPHLVAVQGNAPRQPQKGSQVARSFERMADTLGSMVC